MLSNYRENTKNAGLIADARNTYLKYLASTAPISEAEKSFVNLKDYLSIYEINEREVEEHILEKIKAICIDALNCWNYKFTPNNPDSGDPRGKNYFQELVRYLAEDAANRWVFIFDDSFELIELLCSLIIHRENTETYLASLNSTSETASTELQLASKIVIQYFKQLALNELLPLLNEFRSYFLRAWNALGINEPVNIDDKGRFAAPCTVSEIFYLHSQSAAEYFNYIDTFSYSEKEVAKFFSDYNSIVEDPTHENAILIIRDVMIPILTGLILQALYQIARARAQTLLQSTLKLSALLNGNN